MTREQAIKALKWFKEYNEEDYCGGDRIQDEHGDWYYRITEQDFEAFDVAIKALEQEPVIDKIRAEIAEYGSIMVSYAITKDTKTDKGIEKLVSGVLKQAKEQVLEIIDKYKAESEDKE